jgi:hypothetical protein
MCVLSIRRSIFPRSPGPDKTSRAGPERPLYEPEVKTVFPLQPGSTTAFFSPDLGIEIKFIKSDNRKVTSLSVFDRDFWDRVN